MELSFILEIGFGFALAKKLDALGCNVYAGCLSPEKEGAHTLQRETSKRLRIVSLDVASDDSVQRAKETVVKDIGTRGKIRMNKHCLRVYIFRVGG